MIMSRISKTTTALILGLAFSINCWAQDASNALGEILGKERVQLLSNKNVYFTNETVYFTAFNQSPVHVKEMDLSKVLYIEIVTPNGLAVHQGKFAWNSTGSSGSLIIPTSLVSGNYYLKSYTAWMQNTSPDLYAYLPIKIVNPNSPYILEEVKNDDSQIKELEPIPTLKTIDFSLSNTQFEPRGVGTLRFDKESAGNMQLESVSISIVPEITYHDSLAFSSSLIIVDTTGIVIHPQEKSIKGLQIILQKEFYLKHKVDSNGSILIEVPDTLTSDFVSIDLKLPNNERVANMPIRLVPVAANDLEINPNPDQTGINGVSIYPDVSGIGLEGFIGPSSKLDYKDLTVVLTCHGIKTDLLFTTPNEDGTFHFSLPNNIDINKINLSVLNVDAETSNLRMNINDKFCTEEIHLPFIPFELTDEEELFVKQTYISEQIKQQYARKDLPPIKNKDDVSIFYGTPAIQVYMKDFIELPKIEEYFDELIREVRVIKRKNGEKGFKLLTDNFESSYLEPLLMIDNVPVNAKAIFDMDPKKVKSIDIELDPYQKGEKKFAGIINLITKKSYESRAFVQKDVDINSYTSAKPKPQETVNESDLIPDFRNSVYWQVQNGIEDLGGELSFSTPDRTGSYIILIRGVNKEGDLFFGSDRFIISN